MLRAYRAAARRKPLTVGFVICGIKGILADGFTQVVVEGKKNLDEYDWKRTL